MNEIIQTERKKKIKTVTNKPIHKILLSNYELTLIQYRANAVLKVTWKYCLYFRSPL